jgi:hypothetical protein
MMMGTKVSIFLAFVDKALGIFSCHGLPWSLWAPV